MSPHDVIAVALSFVICISCTLEASAAKFSVIGGLQQQRSLLEQQAPTAASGNQSADSTCPNNLPRVTCTNDPCMRYPCPHGEIGAKNECGKCYCSCSPDNSSTQASITFPTNGTTSITAAADKPDEDGAAVEAAQLQALFLEEAILPALLYGGQCAAIYRACTCSKSCCEGLVCGFPIIRGSAFEQQTGAAFQPVPRAQTDDAQGTGEIQLEGSVTNNGSSNRRSLKLTKQQQNEQEQQQQSTSSVFGSGSKKVAALGPSCRPLPEVDLVTGVVNYGCS
ncbi:hypothetical protein COO60DRAFT_959581 [Scenedesmus sp. NREL 46B-D3]|nr:hypothetical protein COO60DRAFT_959581 [Scenedesmus sp. NREL 46B-D3]